LKRRIIINTISTSIISYQNTLKINSNEKNNVIKQKDITKVDDIKNQLKNGTYKIDLDLLSKKFANDLIM